ncbi:MAG: ATP-binding cassette domain-containing protein [Planctomycetes bacterium]|nr:ATP-binding cassette domain-containing protein [Planctomycetota bacterium]
MAETYDSYIDLRGIHLRRNSNHILKGIDWRMRRGENWAVIGANGSGKTTLLQIAGGILFPTAGEATVLGARFGACDLFQLRRRIGWVSSALSARMPTSDTALEIVVSAFRATFGLVYEYTSEDREKAENALHSVGLADRMNTNFGFLSQGEQQKTLFARAMMANPELYILDEACSGLDLQARESFLQVVESVIDGGRAGVVMVTHHIEEIPSSITHSLVLKGGEVLAAGLSHQVMNGEILSQAFCLPVLVEERDRRFWARVGHGDSLGQAANGISGFGEN